MPLKVETELPQLMPDTVFNIGSFQVTNAMLAGVLLTVLLVLFIIYFRKNVGLKPAKFQLGVELLVSGMADFITSITGDRKVALKILPLIATIFIYIGLSNILILIPGLSSITYEGIPVFRTHTNDFNTTFSIALGIVIVTHYLSAQKFGIVMHFDKYFKYVTVYRAFRKGIKEGLISLVDLFVGLLDLVSDLAKSLSLSLRLFGNMFAGEVLAAFLLGSFAIILPAPWLGMNLFVGLVQALIFGSLAAAYIGIALQE